MNKRGDLFGVIIMLVVMFLVFLFFAGWIFGFGLLTAQVTQNTNLNSGGINITQVGAQTFGQINTSLQSLRWIALVMTFGMVISIFVSNALVKVNPVFSIVYILMAIIGVVFSVYLSNAYEFIIDSGNALVPTLQSFTAMDYLLLHLPIFTTIVGVLGAIFLFINIGNDSEGVIV